MDTETPNDNQPTEAGPENETSSIDEGVARTKQLRERLLVNLPTLSYSTWTLKDDFRLDEELGNVITVNADAILMPLERLAPEPLN